MSAPNLSTLQLEADIEPRWKPSAALARLHQRASILQSIREFFAERKILEVETPLLCHTSVTDPFIESIPAFVAANSKPYYLQTSPEYAMKRLLAAGSGAIYQICKAFRQGEIGRHHNPEFSMIEWYRPDFDHHQLMDDVDDLLQHVLKMERAQRISYAELFQSTLAIDPHSASVAELIYIAEQQQLIVADRIEDKDTWLNLLMSHCIDPSLGFERPVFVYDFPATQAALSQVRQGSTALASRFEVYVQGMELANGFHELQNADEQYQRFAHNNVQRNQMQREPMVIDQNFIAALTAGLPDCAGVALGLDRLVMLATGAKSIPEVLSFDFSRV